MKQTTIFILMQLIRVDACVMSRQTLKYAWAASTHSRYIIRCIELDKLIRHKTAEQKATNVRVSIPLSRAAKNR